MQNCIHYTLLCAQLTEDGPPGQTGLTAVKPVAMAAGFGTDRAASQLLSTVGRTALVNPHRSRIASCAIALCIANGLPSQRGPPAVFRVMEAPHTGPETSAQLCTVETSVWETAQKSGNAILRPAQVVKDNN